MMRSNKLFFLPLLLFLLISCSKDNDNKITPQAGVNVVGYVKDQNGSPVSGVVISDGLNCVATDKDGVYQLRAVSGSRLVSISVPSEYEIPMSVTGMPKMYNRIQLMKNKIVQSDFKIKERLSPDHDFSLIAMADIQIDNDKDVAIFRNDILPGSSDYIKNNIQGPKYGIALGDEVWDRVDYFTNPYSTMVASIGIPFFQVIGNHDHDMTVTDDAASAIPFMNAFGPVNYSWNIGDVHFVVLDDIIYSGYKNYVRGFTDDQITWLNNDLKYVSKDKFIVVGIHAPTERRYYPDATGYCLNSDALYSALAGYKTLILAGHLHHNYKVSISDGITEVEHAAMCGDCWVTDMCNDGSPRGFSVYHFSGNEWDDNYFVGASTGKDLQMKIYKPGKYATIRSSITGAVINIFNWHYNWTVKVDEDGYETTLDPHSNIKVVDYDYYVRNKAGAAAYCDHFFEYKPKSDSWKRITVSAADPFGNSYSQSISN